MSKGKVFIRVNSNVKSYSTVDSS